MKAMSPLSKGFGVGTGPEPKWPMAIPVWCMTCGLKKGQAAWYLNGFHPTGVTNHLKRQAATHYPLQRGVFNAPCAVKPAQGQKL